ncbi:hypothetical protein BD94_0452 [Elizabethkingia anophelis NUHP1]|uniref:Uncharacterized protein n=1 Tax=Elizabethkingia anophelis NUHP1 TaxID=1338011 RepID=A0A077E9M1_9FLAO|nr:hypothetical protein BD94_0452 [Elizabethkingia anophelis NUHP1]
MYNNGVNRFAYLCFLLIFFGKNRKIKIPDMLTQTGNRF